MQHAPVHDSIPFDAVNAQILDLSTKIADVERRQGEIEAALEGRKTYRWMKTEVLRASSYPLL